MASEIFRCVAGSNLFGTAVSSSDTDYKAVYIPSARQILLGGAGKVRDSSTGNKETPNTADDVDDISFPLHKFLQCLTKMETNALEMLHATNMHDNTLWQYIGENKFQFMTSNKSGFVGFGKSQAMRYSVRGDRLDSLLAVVELLEGLHPGRKIHDQIDYTKLSSIKGVKVWNKLQPGNVHIMHMSLFGREISMTLKPTEAIKIFRKPIDEAGKRTVDASASGGADWKGLYHAHRIVDEGIELFSTGGLVFPLVNRDEYISIRNGEFSVEEVLDRFDAKLEQLEALSPISDFADKANKEAMDELVYRTYQTVVILEKFEDQENV